MKNKCIKKKIETIFFSAEKFKRCHRNDPDIDKCLQSTIQNAFKIIGSTGEFQYLYIAMNKFAAFLVFMAKSVSL